MEIIDSHFHLWDTADLDYELFRGHPQLSGSFRLARYVAEARAYGATGAICVEAASAGADGVLETQWLLRETEGSDFVKGIVAWAPLDDQKRIEDHLDWLQACGSEKIVGVRRSFEWEPDDFPRRREVINGCRAAGERGLVVDLVMFCRSLRATIDLVAACPRTRFVLDHLGKPGIREGRLNPWQEELSELATYPNVVCKLSGVTTEADRAATDVYEHVHAYIEHALATFGPRRMLYGSDWPIVGLSGGYAAWWQMLLLSIRGATEDEQNAVCGLNAAETYALNLKRAGHAPGRPDRPVAEDSY